MGLSPAYNWSSSKHQNLGPDAVRRIHIDHAGVERRNLGIVPGLYNDAVGLL